MASSTLALLKREKRNTAAYLHSECLQTSNPSSLHDLLNIFLDPEVSIGEWENKDWLRWLMAGGRTPDQFATTVRMYDNASSCGLVWTANFVAYRCRTCGISPCMSLCAECFQRGNHDGHDFNMFRSQAGGACDCGDSNVMRSSGFCVQHQEQSIRSVPAAPKDLLCLAEAMTPRIIFRLIQHLRHNSKPDELESLVLAAEEADGFIEFIHELSDMGAAMRQVLTSALCNPVVYSDLCSLENDFMKESVMRYEMAKNSIPLPELPRSFNSLLINGLKKVLTHDTLLDELVFWTIKYEFPQKLVCLLLNMLPDSTYKEAFTSTFVHHYARVAVLLSKSKAAEAFANHVVHISVQLFSNEALSLRMCEKQKLLHIIVFSLKNMLSQILMQSNITDPSINFHYVVNCANRLMKHHCYWPLVSDLSNILSHQGVALMFLQDDCLLETWFEILAMLQGMNVNKRELEDHIEFEPNTYYAAFSAEIEASASPMWSFISHLKDPKTLHLTRQTLSFCLQELRTWFDAIGYTTVLIDDPLRLTFHLPLHRYLASFICNAIKNQNAAIEDISDVIIWKEVMIHPLRVQIAFYEIMNGLWVRNGIQMKGQAMTYTQCKFCNSMVDPDIYLLQLAAMNIEADYFIHNVITNFNVMDWFTLKNTHNSSSLDPNQEELMLLGCFNFIATIITLRNNTGMSPEDVLKQEMMTLLCISDRTHSQLIELLPEKCGSADLMPNRTFESTLQQISEYVDPNLKSGGNMSQGMYVPKSDIWEHGFDPIFALLRAVHRREYQATLDRFNAYVKQSGKFKNYETLWPPYRIPERVDAKYKRDLSSLIFCDTFYSIIFIVLFKSLNHAHSTDHILPLTIFFIDIALNYSEQCSSQSQIEPVLKPRHVMDNDFQNWFSSKHFLTVIQENIERVYFDGSEDGSCGSKRNKFANEFDLVNIDDLFMDDSEIEQPAVGAGPEHMAIQYATMHEVDGTNALVPMSVDTSYTNVVESPPIFLPLPSSSSPSPPLNTALALTASTSFVEESLAVVPSFSNSSDEQFQFALESNGKTTSSENPVKALTYTAKKSSPINESILSMLVKIHCKLSDGKRNSYVPKSRRPPLERNQTKRSAIGDGAFFIAQTLDKICDLIGCDAIEKICDNLWPQKQEKSTPTKSGQPDSPFSTLDKEERKRRAKDHQKKLMAEFASRQKAFLKKNMESVDMDATEEKAGPSTSFCDESYRNQIKEYDCVICGQSSPSTVDRPIGLVTLLQASSVLGHSVLVEKENNLSLPCSEKGEENIASLQNRACFMRKRIDVLRENFPESVWQKSLNIGWEGGVYARSCNHYLHLDCQKSYMQSLRREHTLRNQSNSKLAVDRGEYWCPLCRQLANTVLPCGPDAGQGVAMVKSRTDNLTDITKELADILGNWFSPQVSDVLKCMVLVMEDITNATYPRFRSFCPSPNPHSLLLFVCSIARTNLELELFHRGGKLCEDKVSKSCFSHLFKVLALNMKILNNNWYTSLWSKLTGLSNGDLTSVSLVDQEVPLLVQDPVAVLIQLMLILPANVDKAFYNCISQALFNLTCIQALTIVCNRSLESERLRWRNSAQRDINVLGINHRHSLFTTLGIMVENLNNSSLFLPDANLKSQNRIGVMTSNEIEEMVQQYCMSFVRLASLLQHHLYGDSLPILESNNEFNGLCKYLGFQVNGDHETSRTSVVDYLSWAACYPSTLLPIWYQELAEFVSQNQSTNRLLVDRPLGWAQPKLLTLPHEYNKIFQFYHKKECNKCYRIPKDPSICLICGTIVCLRELCCRKNKTLEAVQHSVSCGAGTAMFLVVNSSTIIVIRDRRACIWGSVYLDIYGEEDRDLKRGKPLFLCKERYSLLENQWVTHTFDNTNKHWIWHKDNL